MTVTVQRGRPGARFSNDTLANSVAELRDLVSSRARCQGYDPDLFFPLSDGPAANPARRICARCSVRPQCRLLAFAINDQWAVMGGLTATERRELKSKGEVL